MFRVNENSIKVLERIEKEKNYKHQKKKQMGNKCKLKE